MTSKLWKDMFLQLLSRAFSTLHDCLQLHEKFSIFYEINVRNIIFQCFYRMMVHAGFPVITVHVSVLRRLFRKYIFNMYTLNTFMRPKKK